MKVFNFFKNKKTIRSSDSVFKNHLYEAFDLTEFSVEQKLGVLFQMGLTLPFNAIESDVSPIDFATSDQKSINEYMNELFYLFTDLDLNWDSFPHLDIKVFQSNIYNFNYILHRHLYKSNDSIDENLKKIREINLVIGKTAIDQQWEQSYIDENYSLNSVNRLFYDFINKNGRLLLDGKCSFEEAFAAGVAFYFKIVSNDYEGTRFLIHYLNHGTPPLFSVFREFPLLYKYYKKEFVANHLFSSVFQFFTNGIDPEILMPVHQFHQFLFYEEKSIKFRDVWDFNKNDPNVLIAQFFMNAIKIRETIFYSNKNTFLASNEIYYSDAKNKSITTSELFSIVQEVILKKYHYNFELDPINSKGEFMELCAMIYYETCLHAMVVDDLTDDIEFDIN